MLEEYHPNLEMHHGGVPCEGTVSAETDTSSFIFAMLVYLSRTSLSIAV